MGQTAHANSFWLLLSALTVMICVAAIALLANKQGNSPRPWPFRLRFPDLQAPLMLGR
jgi:hypothetical protein